MFYEETNTWSMHRLRTTKIERVSSVGGRSAAPENSDVGASAPPVAEDANVDAPPAALCEAASTALCEVASTEVNRDTASAMHHRFRSARWAATRETKQALQRPSH